MRKLTVYIYFSSLRNPRVQTEISSSEWKLPLSYTNSGAFLSPGVTLLLWVSDLWGLAVGRGAQESASVPNCLGLWLEVTQQKASSCCHTCTPVGVQNPKESASAARRLV